MSILNKYCSFEISIHQRIRKKGTWFPQKYSSTTEEGEEELFIEQQVIILAYISYNI